MFFMPFGNRLLHLSISPVDVPPRRGIAMNNSLKVLETGLRPVGRDLHQLQGSFGNCPFCKATLVSKPNRLLAALPYFPCLVRLPRKQRLDEFPQMVSLFERESVTLSQAAHVARALWQSQCFFNFGSVREVVVLMVLVLAKLVTNIEYERPGVGLSACNC